MNHVLSVIGSLVVVLVLLGVPVLSAGVLFYYSRKSSSGAKRVGLAIGGSFLFAWLTLIGTWAVKIAPWSPTILCRGFSPEGREYCAVQTFQDPFEPYKVSFYIRDARGLWRWHYLAHQDNAWRSIKVEFTPESIRVSSEGVLRKELPRQPTDLDRAWLGAGEKYRYRPARFTVEDLAAFHGRMLTL